MANEISEKTRMPIKSVAALIGMTIVATGTFISLKQDIAELKAMQRQSWTRYQQIEWAQTLKDMNGESLKVPRVEFVEKGK